MPPHPDIQKIAEGVLRRPYYRLGEEDFDFLPLLRRIGDFIEWLLSPLAWIRNFSPLLYWLIVCLLVLLLVAILYHLCLTILRAFGDRRGSARGSLIEGERPSDPELWERRGREAHRLGDDVEAIRCLLFAGLIRLESRANRRLQRGLTNREYLRRHRGTRALRPLSLLVNTVDLKWYGGEACSAGDYETCESAYAQLLSPDASKPDDQRT